MSYDALIKRNVKRAFKLVKDIGIEVIFVKQNINTFDFETGEVDNHLAPFHIQAKVIIVDTVNKERNLQEKEIYVNTQEVPSLKLTEYVIISGINWKIGKMIEHNNYLTQFNVFKE